MAKRKNSPRKHKIFHRLLDKETREITARIGDLEYKNDFAPLSSRVTALREDAHRLANWTQGGRFDLTAAQMLWDIAVKWLSLKALLHDYGIAPNQNWVTKNLQVRTIASALHDLDCDVCKNAKWLTQIIPPPFKTSNFETQYVHNDEGSHAYSAGIKESVQSLGSDDCFGMPHLEFANRLEVIASLLREFLLTSPPHPPTLLPAPGLTPITVPTIWFHGGQSYSTDGKNPCNVSNEMHNVLKVFLNKNQSQTTSTIEKAGVSNVAKVMTKLNTRFSGAVQKPRSRGEGYFILVRSLTPTG